MSRTIYWFGPDGNVTVTPRAVTGRGRACLPRTDGTGTRTPLLPFSEHEPRGFVLGAPERSWLAVSPGQASISVYDSISGEWVVLPIGVLAQAARQQRQLSGCTPLEPTRQGSGSGAGLTRAPDPHPCEESMPGSRGLTHECSVLASLRRFVGRLRPLGARDRRTRSGEPFGSLSGTGPSVQASVGIPGAYAKATRQ